MVKRVKRHWYFSAVCFLVPAVFFYCYGKDTVTWRAIPEFADSIGLSCQWERSFSRLTCRSATTQVRLYEGNAFCLVNGSARRLPVAPTRQGATLYLPQSVLSTIFGPAKDIVMSGPPPAIPSKRMGTTNIVSVVSEKKKNGTLITIQLADSLPFDVTYFYPNLTFNFFGGTLDTSRISQENRIGIVDSIFSIQFEVSAQITALLSREIEEPMVDYVQDTKMIMVSLWPKKTVSVNSPPVKLPDTQKSTIVTSPKKNEPDTKKNSTIKNTTIVVIDPGHGGKDPGAISSNGIKEKDVVLTIGLKVRELLRKKPGVTVFMTREKDVFVPLSDRTEFANNKRAHLFISIHADAVDGDEKRKASTKGYKIYFLSQAKNEDDKLAAMRENAVIELEERPQRYSELQNVLIDIAGNEYLRESQEMCIFIERKFNSGLDKKITKLHKGIGQANFWVLNGAFMPSVLIETGFLSHEKEEQLLNDSEFQKRIANAVGEAVVSFSKKFGGAGL